MEGWEAWHINLSVRHMIKFSGVVDLNSGEIQDVLSLLPYEVYSPAVPRDNRWLYFVRGASEADIWLLTLN